MHTTVHTRWVECVSRTALLDGHLLSTALGKASQSSDMRVWEQELKVMRCQQRQPTGTELESEVTTALKPWRESLGSG